MSFEVIDHDLAARIGRLKTDHGAIETPTIFPVINPGKQIIKASEMKKYGAEAVITNAYILWKNFREEALAAGVHGFLDFAGPIMTDSGAFQLMEYGDVEISNQDMIDFQKKILSDIATIIDVPTASDDLRVIKKCVDETIRRAQESVLDSRIWVGPIQGKNTIHLARCAKALARLDFAVHALGSAVPLLRSYQFSKNIEMIKTVREIIPTNRPLHLFGAGHPMFFPFAVAMGVDLFDSAAYAIFAEEGRYLTKSGTMKINEMSYAPCACPVCAAHEIKEIKEPRLLAEHNLYVTFESLREIKQAIKEKTLFELLERQCRAHPALFACMAKFARQKKYLLKYDPLTKKHLFIISEFSKKQPAVFSAIERKKRVKSAAVRMPIFGAVPKTILECFPFSQTVFPAEVEFEKTKNNIDKANDISLYWFGHAIFPADAKIRTSTGRIRSIHEAGKTLAAFRASDFYIMLHEAAKKLHAAAPFPEHRVVVANEVAEFAQAGKSVFAKFVKSCDEKIVPGVQVLVVDERDNLLAAGDAALAAKEMADFKSGVAVWVRWVNTI